MQTSHDKARFVLKEPSSDKPTLIMLLYRFQGQRLKYSTGEKVHPELWDTQLQRVLTNQKTRFQREQFESINAQLDRYRAVIKRVVAQCKLADILPTTSEIHTHLEKEFGRKPKPVSESAAQQTFFEFVERFLDDCRTGKRLTSQNRQYSTATVKSMTTTFNQLKEYQKLYPTRLDYDAFTLTFYTRFKKYMTAQNYAVNSIGNRIKNIKIFLKEAHREGLHENQIFRHEDFKKIQEETDSIYLSNDELDQIFNMDLSKQPKLDNVRDAFLIGCYTGLRFSDFTQLRPENITHGGKILTITTQKTITRVSIPINPKVLAILAKHDGNAPRVISNQKFNDYLKQVAQKAGLTEKVQIGVTKGGMRVTRIIEKWQLATSHTARRSFATNAYLAGLPAIDIMRMTGHRTETSFMRYIKVTEEETALRLLAHPHFQGNSFKVIK